MYRFISYDEYLNSTYLLSHPNARVNIEKTEVVLSCNNHGDGCDCLSHEEAIEHVSINWVEYSQVLSDE